MSITKTNFDGFASNTRRVYRQAIRDFETVTGIEIGKAKQSHYDLWVTNMKLRKLSVATIRQRISAVSRTNPGLVVTLPKREFTERTCMDANQLAIFLSMIPISLSGHFDFALISIFIAYGPRNFEILSLRRDQIIEKSNGTYLIRLSNKNISLPDSFQLLIKMLIKKQESANQDSYIFTATSNRWRNLPTTNSVKNNRPISSAEFNRRLKKYARLARLNEKIFSVRTLRYTLEFLGQERVIEIIESLLRKRFPQPVLWGSLSHDPRLHGIGRRSQ